MGAEKDNQKVNGDRDKTTVAIYVADKAVIDAKLRPHGTTIPDLIHQLLLEAGWIETGKEKA